MLKELYSVLPESATIRYSGVTGYGENLIKTALNVDLNEIETIAHYTAAKRFMPNVTSIVDIGGQDMKYIKMKNHTIDNIMLNEACSSGCGSFMHGNPTGSSQSRRTYPEKRRTLCPKCNTVGNPGCISTWNVFHRMACRSGGTPGADNR